MEIAIKAIIFGSNGQDGYYTKKLLEREGIPYRAISRSAGAIQGDVGDFRFVEMHIKEFQPTHIFHFAASSTARHSALFDNHNSISTGTINILESVRTHSPGTRVFICGSALQFQNTGEPIDEKTPFDASSPYAVARIHSVYAARYYRQHCNTKVYAGYFFHHDSPLRSEQHVNKKITVAVNKIRQGSNDKLELGDIDVSKEFNFAGDIVEAVWILMNQDSVFEAVIGSGKAYRIRDWVDYCFSKIGQDWKKHVVMKEGFVSDFNKLVSNPSVMMNLGWTPKVSFYQLADLMMESEQSNSRTENRHYISGQ